MAQAQIHPPAIADTVDSESKWLYRIGQAAVWLALLIFRRWLGAEIMLLRSLRIIRIGPKAIPTSALDCFNLLNAHPLVGLTLLNAFDMVNFILAAVVFLVLYAVLKRVDRNFMALAVALMFVAVLTYIASNPAFPMLALAGKYAAAATDAQRTLLLSAGEAVLAAKNPNAFGQNLAFTFFHVAGLIACLLMLRSGSFSKPTSWCGLLFNGFGLGFPLGMALFPGVAVIPEVAWITAVIFWVFWYIGIARTFHRLARDAGAARAPQARFFKADADP